MRKAHIPVAVFGGFLGLLTAVYFAPVEESVPQLQTVEKTPALAPQDVEEEGAYPASELALMRSAQREALRLALTQPLFVQTALETGDTLIAAMQRQGVSGREAHLSVKALKGVYDPRDFRAGQELTLHFGPVEKQDRPFVSIIEPAHASQEPALGKVPGDARPFFGYSFRDGYERAIIVSRSPKEDFIAEEKTIPLQKEQKFLSTEIKNSLYQDGLKAGASHKALSKLMRALSYDVDFQRDIRRGDSFAMLYDVMLDPETQAVVRTEDLTFASMRISGKDLKVYRFTPKGGKASYYDDEGRNIRKALLRTPVDGARMSSGFGKRRHPILGYSKMHKGVDFAAPTGTPIMAAGNGVVVKSGRWGAYGNYVRLKHHDGYQTAYAHMSRIAKSARKGRRVKQGQIIGYVGSTGRSTGPHLHYEILVNNKHRNPMSVKMPRGTKLGGADLKAFRQHKAEIDRHVSTKMGFLVSAARADKE